MDDATVFALAKQAEFYTAVTYNELIRFAALVAAHEREECAKVCEDKFGAERIALECAAAIRSRT